MIAIKANEFRDNFKGVCDRVVKGEKVIISRPHNENVVVLSEAEYNELEKSHRNTAYLAKIDRSIEDIEKGRSVTFSMDELEALETMSAVEAKEHIKAIRKGQVKTV